MRRGRARYCTSFLILALSLWVGRTAHAANTTTVIYNFTGGSDGGNPTSTLSFDAAGNAYGTAVIGGDFNFGVVYQLTPSANGWTETVLHSFSGAPDGQYPYGGVVIDSAGNLYGGTTSGGAAGCDCGVIYKLTNSGGHWTESVVYSFPGGKYGASAGSPLVFDNAGNLYGTTPDAGAHGFGTIFQLVPGQNGQWSEKVIHGFTGGKDGGIGSLGPLLIASNGTIYGIAEVGGASGFGTTFRIVPQSNGTWKGATIDAFKGAPNAGSPYGGLILDSAGNLYGTTYYGGSNNVGTVYELSKSGASWQEKVLYSFGASNDGNQPTSTLVFDSAGDLYGTTSAGGDPGCGCGTIFELTPQGSSWTETTVHNFSGDPDAAFPSYGLTPDGKGNYFGATPAGGSHNQGAVFQFTP